MAKSKVRLELLPWVTKTCVYEGPGRLVLEEPVEEGATIGTLLRKMASQYQAFGEAVFDPSTQKLSGYVSIVLNGRFLDFLLDGLDTPVKDGDVILFFPAIIEGG